MTDLLSRIEHEALDRLEEEAGRVEADIDAAADLADAGAGPDDEAKVPVGRLVAACTFPVIGAAVMVGGVFVGVGARFWAAAGGVLGMALAVLARRVRKPALANVVVAVGLFAIGLVLLVPTGPGNIARAGSLASEAAASGDVLRPPVAFTAGWQAIVGWLMGIVGFAAVWVATVVKKGALALLVPVPVAAIAGISVPEYAQVPSGIAVLVLFAIGLGLLSSARQAAEGAELPLGYEVRKLVRALPLIGAITVGLVLLAQTDFLFPEPRIDPAEEPQRPRTVPLDEVEDRVLFEVTNTDGGPLQVSGPWRMGVLDVYDGTEWRLPAFNDGRIEPIDRQTGVVLEERLDDRGLRASFRVAGLGGAALPSLPNTIGIFSPGGPELVYDTRSQGFRVAAGQAPSGLRFDVAAARLPTVTELTSIPLAVPADLQEFTEVPEAPPAVAALLEQARSEFSTPFEQFDFLRNYVLDEVTATGTGTPVAIPPSRVEEILGQTLEASPYEIVATQALLARWVGLPARIGYGFDGGEVNGNTLEVRPRHGASFPEVWFGDYGWLPFIGTPRKAEPSVGADPSQQQIDPDVLPSEDIAVQLFLPALVPPPTALVDVIRRVALGGLLLALLVGTAYVAFPAIRKVLLRGRRRSAARAAGPRARVALAYSEWRDHATDFGYRFPNDTPLMFLDRFVEDTEHTELAWLTTRALWGDLQDELDTELASTTEELSRALRRRLSAAQPATMRFVAAVSRLSLKDPFAPGADLTRRGRRHRDDEAPPLGEQPVEPGPLARKETVDALA